MDNIVITIDGKKVNTKKGNSVLKAALDAGIYIPNLCYDPRLKPYGSCRLCMVEIEGMRGLPASCTTEAADGMVVRTNTSDINNVRRITAELLIADHPQECLTCGSNQRCDLQKAAAYLGIDKPRMRKSTRDIPVDESNPFYGRDMSRCILCGKCVRACDEIRGVNAIDIGFRGYSSRICAPGDLPVIESTCESCGECIDICPTGALYAKGEALQPVSSVKTTCPYCGVGCNIALGVRDNRIVTVTGDYESPVNTGSLCVKGRFGMDFVNSPERLKKPLIKENNRFREASWDEALSLVARRFTGIKEKHGPDAIAGLSSAKCSNEENYLMQKFMRAAIGTNNVDHCARLCHASTVAGLARAFGSGAMTNSIDEIENAGCMLITGSNTTETHPVISLRIKKAVRENGAKLIVVDPRKIDITGYASIWLRQKPGTDVALFNGMMNVIISEGLYDRKFVEERTEGFEEIRGTVKKYTPGYAERITGVPAGDIRAAARMYSSCGNSSIFFAMGITQHVAGTQNVLTLANLAMLTGNVGKESAGVNPLRGQNNVQGACDLGALPNVYPGYQQVTDTAVKEKFEKYWGVKLSGNVGLTVLEMIHAVEEGKVRAMYEVGENPMLSDPNANRTKAAFDKLEFLVVQDIFLSETAQLADVVLPAASFAEKDGTFTNTERRVQRIRKVIEPPGEAKPDWWIISKLAEKINYKMKNQLPEDVMAEIASLTPIYGGMYYDRLEKDGLQWPCLNRDHPGTKYLHRGEFKRGKGKFHMTRYEPSPELPDREYPFVLTTGRILEHFHTGTMTRRSDGLNALVPEGTVEMNPKDAKKLKLKSGNLAEVSSRRGKITIKTKITGKSPEGVVFISFHFKESAANLLTIDTYDPIAKIPELKVCAVKIKKCSAKLQRQ
jgi:formate dehydrogenase alpha subunit